MGYVLPIQMDTYRQYANRTTLHEKETITLDPVMKPVFHRVDSQYTWQEMQRNNMYVPKKRKQNQKENHTWDDSLLAEITGKGRLFNESI
ncbi:MULTISPECIES: hypothetical protein [Bacillus]|uniref:hypothetical protein n=1 Tax=Bacillus TaxID=1386 RepID=UPI000BB68E07|nr:MULTISPECIES: hypothetical protein [Bacillus]